MKNKEGGPRSREKEGRDCGVGRLGVVWCGVLWCGVVWRASRRDDPVAYARACF